MGNEEMEKSQERGEEGKDMLNGVGGLEIWWRLVAHPDDKPLGRKGVDIEITTAGKWKVLIPRLAI